MVKKTEGIDIDIYEIPLDDKKTYKMLGRGETMGMFQMSGAGMTKYIKDLKPERVEDLMAMVALYRPGPIAVIPEYIKRKKNPKLVKYLDPRMEKFLGSSYGLIVYQDDLLFCAIDLAGYTWQEADKFRKAVGKKIPEEMAAQKEKFIQGIKDNGQTKKFAEDLWKLFEPFQAYGFNKAHAASYGMVAYYTAYMKANYPVEFMTALMSSESSDTEKVSLAVEECRRIKIKVLPPDIYESEEDFKVIEDKSSLDGKAIRFGLNAIKHVGAAALSAIIEAREDGEFINFADFLSRVDSRKVNKKVLESLIKVGALEKFGKRAALIDSIDEIRDKVGKRAKDDNQQGLFSVDDIKKSASGVLNVNLNVKEVPEFDEEELQFLERQLLGFSLSAKPISELIADMDMKASHKIHELEEDEFIEQNVTLVAVIKDVRVIITKKSAQEMAFVKVEDGTGTIDLVVFPSIYSDTRGAWKDNNVVLIEGKVDRRDETSSLIVQKIKTKDDFENGENEKLYIKIPKGVTPGQLKELKTILVDNPGDKSVTLKFEGNKKEIRLQHKIDWNQNIAMKISNIFGVDN